MRPRLHAIVTKLQDPEAGSAAEVVQEREIETYHRDPDKADLLAALARVQTYVVNRPSAHCRFE